MKEDLKDTLKIPEEVIDELASKAAKEWFKSIKEIPDVVIPEEDAVMGKFKTLFDLRIQLIHHSLRPSRICDETSLVIKDARTREEIIYDVESKEDIKEFLCQYIDDLFEEPLED